MNKRKEAIRKIKKTFWITLLLWHTVWSFNYIYFTVAEMDRGDHDVTITDIFVEYGVEGWVGYYFEVRSDKWGGKYQMLVRSSWHDSAQIGQRFKLKSNKYSFVEPYRPTVAIILSIINGVALLILAIKFILIPITDRYDNWVKEGEQQC